MGAEFIRGASTGKKHDDASDMLNDRLAVGFWARRCASWEGADHLQDKVRRDVRRKGQIARCVALRESSFRV
eukprot:5113349-Karenia_brevis.AAC.1